ncbi:MAG: 4Fe-4S dicluster domain-containing protein [Planctomycetota bacterium]|jgi:ferredoxin
MSVQEEIRKTAAQLLAEAKVDLVIGFGAGSLPMRTTPCFITEADAAQQLVWNSYCLNNLAVYLPRCFAPDPRVKEQKPPPKVAIILKGCDGRSAVGLIKERQVSKENLVIIAAPCEGMLDVTIAQQLMGTNEIVSAEESDGTVTIKDERGKGKKFNREELLAEACRFCTHRAAPVCDVAIGELPQGPDALAPDGRFEEFLKKSTEEKWEQFCREISKCILCNACRSACPNCYCKVCFADQTRPNWTGSGEKLRDVISYHLGRVFHQAGRCTDCGACVRACPMGVDLRTFTYGLVKDAKELFGYTAGLDLEHVPPLMDFNTSDSDSFITEPE